MNRPPIKHGDYTKQPYDYEPLVQLIRTKIYDLELQLFAATALVAATRAGEISRLRVKDVDGEFVHIEKTKCKRDGRMRKVDPYRKIVKPKWYAMLVDNYLKAVRPDSRNELLFQKKNNRFGGQLATSGVNARVRRIMDMLGADTGGITPTMHSFRKTCLNHLFEKSGRDLRAPQIHAGHRSLASTAHYLDYDRKKYAARNAESLEVGDVDSWD